MQRSLDDADDDYLVLISDICHVCVWHIVCMLQTLPRRTQWLALAIARRTAYRHQSICGLLWIGSFGCRLAKHLT